VPSLGISLCGHQAARPKGASFIHLHHEYRFAVGRGIRAVRHASFMRRHIEVARAGPALLGRDDRHVKRPVLNLGKQQLRFADPYQPSKRWEATAGARLRAPAPPTLAPRDCLTCGPRASRGKASTRTARRWQELHSSLMCFEIAFLTRASGTPLARGSGV